MQNVRNIDLCRKSKPADKHEDGKNMSPQKNYK